LDYGWLAARLADIANAIWLIRYAPEPSAQAYALCWRGYRPSTPLQYLHPA